MKHTGLKAAFFVCLWLVLLALLSCATPRVADFISPQFEAESIKKIGLLPITYERKYDPPLKSDIGGRDLSRMITLRVKRVLSNKGYAVELVSFPAAIAAEEPFIPLNIEPAVLAENASADVDGLMQVYVTFHFGINPDEYSSSKGEFRSHGISLYAKARLVDSKNAIDLWQDGGRARTFYSGLFFGRLNDAVSSLAKSMFVTLPDRE